MNERIEAVRTLLQLFKVERILYVLMSLISVAMILFVGFKLVESGASSAHLVGIFGAGGLISVGVGRLLTMWTQALRMVAGEDISE